MERASGSMEGAEGALTAALEDLQIVESSTILVGAGPALAGYRTMRVGLCLRCCGERTAPR